MRQSDELYGETEINAKADLLNRYESMVEKQINTVAEIEDERIVWANFDSLIDTIETVLERDVGNAEASMFVPTERERSYSANSVVSSTTKTSNLNIRRQSR